MTEKIKYKPVDLTQQFIRRIMEEKCYIDLHENHLVYSCVFYADEPVDAEDKALGLTERKTDMLITVLKKSISGIEKSVTTTGKRWVVAVLIMGFSDDIKCYFKREDEAQKLYEQLHTWLVN